ncbi:hypothetical protein EMPS_09536 [Entomortierella parvispora]|uniref:Uncharacterized protein n=1 Tax=Entomortierella parvispora TaxID=205924 RepID=A0A9P3HJ06_9FUNG|nr:hypothetical protein EMPS_09536 [Entomortierella parvispora]
MLNERLAALEDSSQRLAAVDFSTPRLYSALLLENQAVPVRNAKPFERNLFAVNGNETIRNVRTREGADEFEATMELATTLNEICQSREIQGKLSHVTAAHEDVLQSISDLQAKLSELESASGATGDSQENNSNQEGDEIGADITREEGEIFALEQILNEKRQTLRTMEQELNSLTDIADTEHMDQDASSAMEVDSEMEAEIASSKAEIEEMEAMLEEQRQREVEQAARLEQLQREYEELEANQLERKESTTEQESDPHFEEFLQLWEKVENAQGDADIEPVGVREAHQKIELLLEDLEKTQRHIVQLDVIQQISINLIANCADSTLEFDPPRTPGAILAARSLRAIYQAGGSVPLPTLKDLIAKEAVDMGVDRSRGIQTVYSLIAAQLIQLDRTANPNMAYFG